VIAHIASLALLSVALVQEPTADLAGRLQSIARGAIAESGLPGVSVRIATRDGVLLSRGLGYLDVELKRIESPLAPRDGEALVEPLIVTGLLAQVDQGKLALQASLTDFFPKLSFGGQRVALLHLVEHASGIPDCSDWLALRDEPATAADVLAWLEQRTLDSDPGACTAYSVSNVVLAGLLLERVTAHPLREHLARQVIEPLGLDETRFEVRAEPREASATLRTPIETPRELLGLPPLRTQLVDLERFVRGLGEGKLVGAANLRELRVGALSLPRQGSRCAGFARSTVACNEALTLGSNGARGSLHVAWYPDLELSITLASSADTEDLPVLERRLTRAILDLPEPGIVDLPVTRGQREVYLGGYYLGCTRVTIEERGETLEYITPYGERHRMRYQGRDRFVSAEDSEVSFEFTVEHGRAVAFVLTQRGTQTTARRLE